jgi:hypothetical protein
LIESFQRPIRKGRLLAYLYDGFCRAMDTLKDEQIEDFERGHMPWQQIG